MRWNAAVLTCMAYASHAHQNPWIRQGRSGRNREDALPNMVESRAQTKTVAERRFYDLATVLLAMRPIIARQTIDHARPLEHRLARHEAAAMQMWPFGDSEKATDDEVVEVSTRRKFPRKRTVPQKQVKRGGATSAKRSVKRGRVASAKEESAPSSRSNPFSFFGNTPEPEPAPAPPPAPKGFSFPSFGAKPEPAPAPAPPEKTTGFTFPSFGSKAPASETPPKRASKTGSASSDESVPKEPMFSFPSFGKSAPPEEPTTTTEKPNLFSFPSFGGSEESLDPSTSAEKPKSEPQETFGFAFPSFGSSNEEEADEEAAKEQIEDAIDSSSPEIATPSDLTGAGTLVGAGLAGATVGGLLVDAAGLGITGELVTDAAALGAVALGGATVYAATRPDEVGEAARYVGKSVSDTTSAYAELAAVNAELAILEQKQKAQAAVDEKVEQIKAIPGQVVAAPGKAADELKTKIETELRDVQSSAKSQVDAARKEIDQLKK